MCGFFLKISQNRGDANHLIPPQLRQKEAQEDVGEEAARTRGEEEGDDVDGVARGVQSHEKGGDGIGGECAEDACAECLGDAGDAETFRIVIGKPARERTDHAAGERHETAEPCDVAEKARGEGDADAPERAEKDGGEDVDEVLDGGAAAAKHGNAEQSAEHGDGDEDAGKGEFAGF